MDFDVLKNKKEIKPILEAIEKLSPWDKVELISNLYFTIPTNAIENMLEEFGYVDSDSIDPVKMVIDNNLVDDVLFEINDWEIADYVNEHPDVLYYVFDNLDVDTLINSTDSSVLMLEASEWFNKAEGIIEKLKEKYPEVYKEWIKEKGEN